MTASTDVDVTAIEEAARRLADAARTRTPCAPVRDLIGATDVDAAYAVQTRNRDAAIAAGRRVAGRARRLGDPLRAGQIVLSGALGPMVTVAPGVVVSAEITGLGSVSCTFEGEENGSSSAWRSDRAAHRS